MGFENKQSLARKLSESLDSVVGIISPKAAAYRKAARFYYDAVNSSDRLNKKRSGMGGTADTQLDEHSLWKQREICRELGRNNPLVSGLLKTEADGVVGEGVSIQAATDDDGWNEKAEQLWKEEMLDRPCEVTGRFNFNEYCRKMYLSYRRDGDMATIYTDAGLQAVEGEQIGTPASGIVAKNFRVVNGIAYSNPTNKVIGYYIGQPDKSGFFIKADSYKKYTADQVHFHFNPERFSQSRGQPALTPSIKYIDYLCGYIDAELVAAKINACFAMFITKEGAGGPFAPPNADNIKDGSGNLVPLEKVQPGMIEYLQPGEAVSGVGMTRPGAMFDPFVMRMLTLIGRPLCMPLMLITLDFAGATFMNARIAYQKVQDMWRTEQSTIITPFASRTWRWKIEQWIQSGLLTRREDAFKHRVINNRWSYIDPTKESKADKQELDNFTVNRTDIVARKGGNFEDIINVRAREEKFIKEKGLEINPPKNTGGDSDAKPDDKK